MLGVGGRSWFLGRVACRPVDASGCLYVLKTSRAKKSRDAMAGMPLPHQMCHTNATTSMSASNNTYETDESLNMYLGLHYSSSLDFISAHEHAPNNWLLAFPQRVAQLLVEIMSTLPNNTSENALDVGCAVGETAFELAKTFSHVDAFDSSETFIDAASLIQAGERVHFSVRMEGVICKQAVVQDMPDRERVNFFTGDACH